MPAESSDYPLAYLITFRTYGSWLHGDDRGSVDRANNQPGSKLSPPDTQRREAMLQRMHSPEFSLSTDQRRCVDKSVREVCDYRGWELYALNIRTNHVHAVVASSATPEKVMNDFKARATRRLRELSLVPTDVTIWSRHGSTRYLWNAISVEEACRYVIDGQGTGLDG
ncbi:transposase [Botrimarina colliarenosi]|uniref:transposase n=1 Tax=Botrimarina colliarenosi TaxID=2528001 RepID=UPI0018D3E32E|nr:transposase [Botrimarina colliarenosi]